MMVKKKIGLLLVLLVFSSCLEAQDDFLRITPIHQVQGSGSISPLLGQKVIVNGIVTAIFAGENRLNGFFIQELNEDENEETSEGVFIYDSKQIFDGAVGDFVQVIGIVDEFKGKKSSLTQIKNIKSVLILSSKNKLPKPKIVTLPIDNWEKYEGMLVEVKASQGHLRVTELYQLGRFGQVTLNAPFEGPKGGDGRLYQFTQFNKPDPERNSDYIKEALRHRVILDDGSGIRNPEVIPFGREGRDFDMFHAIRGGDRVKSIIGIVDDRFDDYRIHPIQSVKFIPANKRQDQTPRLPMHTGLRVASFNVLNYFNGDGKGGGFPTPRGASDTLEFKRQEEKTVNVILKSNADVVALLEIENDGFDKYSAIQGLVNKLNAASNFKREFAACEVSDPGIDAITSAIIYDRNKVEPLGAAATMPDGYGTAAFDSSRRKPIIRTFRDLKTGVEFTLVALHYKSKGIQSPGEGNTDKGDGQGRNNLLRLQQSEDLVSWLQTVPTGTSNPNYILMGDFNSYAMEDPLSYLESFGFTNMLPPASYSFVYDGYWGALDHVLVSPSLIRQVTGAVKWHINADEAPVLDYNMEGKTDEQLRTYYDNSVFRSSDHDPVILGLKLRKKSINHTE